MLAYGSCKKTSLQAADDVEMANNPNRYVPGFFYGIVFPLLEHISVQPAINPLLS